MPVAADGTQGYDPGREGKVPLNQNEERRAIALTAAGIGAWDWDLVTGEIVWSDNLDLIFGLAPGTFGRTYDAFLDLVHPDDRERVERAVARAHAEGTNYDAEFRVCPPSGALRWIAAKGQVIHDRDGSPVRMAGVAWDVTARKAAETELATRVRQQAVVADLGQRAVTGSDLGALFDDAVEVVSETLGLEYAKVLELLPDGQELLLRAGVGWQAGLVGQATVGAETDSQAGYTLLSDQPVIVDDLRTETRFSGPPLLHEHGVISGLSVIIRGRERPFGVLGAHTVTKRTFSQDDAHFLRSVANVLAATIQRAQAEAARREEYFRVLVEHGSDIVSVVDAEGVRRYISPVVAHVLGYQPEELVDERLGSLIHPDDAERQRQLFVSVRAEPGSVLSGEMRVRHKDGSWRHLELIASNRLDDPMVRGIVVTSRDITDRKWAEMLRALRGEVSNALAAGGNLHRVLQRCMEAVVCHLDAAFARVWTLDEAENVLELQASAGLYTHLDGAHARVPVGHLKIGRIAAERQPHLTNDVANDPRISDHGWAEREGMVAFAGYPLLLEDHLVGVVALFARDRLSDNVLEGLESITGLIAQGIERKRAETALQAAEQRFRTLFREAPLMYLITRSKNGEPIVEECNNLFLTTVGYERSEVIGQPLADFYTSASRAALLEGGGYQRALQGQFNDQERQLVTREGRVVETLLRAWPETRSNGTAWGTRVTFVDITERKEAEAALVAERDLLQSIIDNIPDPIFVKDTASRFVRLNRAAARSLGCQSPEEALGKTDFDFFPPELAGGFRAAEQRILVTGQPILNQLEKQVLDVVSQRWLRTSKVPLFAADGRISGLVGSGRDVTEQVQAEQALQQERAFLAAVLENAEEGIVACDADGTLTLFNRATREFHGLPEAPIPPEQWAEHYSLYWPDTQTLMPMEEIPLFRALHGEVVHNAEMVIAPKSGMSRTVLVSGRPIVDTGGATLGAVAVMHDITEQRRAELGREAALMAWQQSFDALPDHLCVLDRSGTILQANRSMRERFEPIHGPLVGLDYRVCYCGTSTPDPQPPWAVVLAGGPAVSLEMTLPTMEGWFLVSSYPIDVEGERQGAVSVVRDITERKVLEQQLAHQAFHDPLTGLPNRALLRDRLDHALLSARRRGEQIAVLFLDLDRFKVINDSLGHARGDDLLSAVTQRLRHHIRIGDTLARLGGDEFVVLVEGVTDAEEAHAAARRLLDALQAPFTLGGLELSVEASIGIVISTADHDRADDLIREADLAMYQAKAAGGNGVAFFEPAMSIRAGEQLALESDLRRALDQDELCLYYQPEVEFVSGEVLSVEALLRWQHPTRRLVPPGRLHSGCGGDAAHPAVGTLGTEGGLLPGTGMARRAPRCRAVSSKREHFGAAIPRAGLR
jgi:diguanylate cyclase (GGDEF)-like protein/PAS domain S-box-containing protein